MQPTRRTVFALAGLLMAGMAMPLTADDRDDGDCPMRGGMGRGMHMGRMMDGGMDAMLDRIDGRLAFIKAELKITEAQTAAWDEFAGTVKASAETRNKMMSERRKEMMSGEFEKKPLPERLEMQEAHISSRLDQVKATRAALGKLYAALDDKQKEAADDIVQPMMGMGGGMHRMMRGMMGRGKDGGMGMGRGMMRDGGR